jgi:hypothetical protein
MPSDPFSLSFTSPFLNGGAGLGIVQREPPAPKLLAGDVRGLRQMLDDMLRHQPMTQAQRENVDAIRNRLAGVQKDLPPSVPLAMATWLQTWDGPADRDAIIAAGNDLLKACALNGEPMVTAETLMKAMTAISERLVGSQMAVGAGGASGMPSEAGDVSAIDWHEPTATKFYVLDAHTGATLSAILEDLRHVDNYRARGAEGPTRLEFKGPPGSGKTSAALWIAQQLGKPAALLRLDSLRSRFLSATARNLRACCEAAMAREYVDADGKTQKGAVVIMDELEAVATRRDASGPNVSEEDKKTTSAFLQLLDDAKLAGLIMIGCTNVPECVDPSVARRLRDHVDFGLPDLPARTSMLATWWAKAPHDDEARDTLLARTEGKNGDYLKRCADAANRTAARRGLEAAIAVADVTRALASMPVETALRTSDTVAVGGGAIVRASETDMGRVLMGGRLG